MIKTVIFDIGNVMVDFCFDKFIRKNKDPEQICERIRKATLESGFWGELDLGILSYEEVLQKFIDMDPELESQIRAIFNDTTGIVLKRDYAIPLVKKLRQNGYQVLALSNFPEKVYLENREPLAFLEEMNGDILSYRDHVIKPDPKIYRLLQERYGFLPEECVFVDDLQENLDAAKEQGWRTILFTGYEQMLAALQELLIKTD